MYSMPEAMKKELFEKSNLLDGYIRIIPEQQIQLFSNVLSSFQTWQGYTPFAITAFGDVFAWDNGDNFIWLYKFVDGDRHAVSYGYENFFDLIKVKSFQEDYFDLSLFYRAKETLGTLNTNECYTFEPLPVVGGTKKLENIGKGDIFSYLAIIAAFS